MKNLLLIILSILFSNVLFSQSVDGVELIDLREQYVSIDCVARSISSYSVLVDFGQETKLIKAKNQELLDESGMPLRVNSPTKALNLMYKYGYEVLEVFQHDGECSYLLKRRVGFDVQ